MGELAQSFKPGVRILMHGGLNPPPSGIELLQRTFQNVLSSLIRQEEMVKQIQQATEAQAAEVQSHRAEDRDGVA